MRQALGLAVAVTIAACASQPQVIFASDPRDKHGWTSPRMIIQGHPQREPGDTLVKVEWATTF